jgi:hypothetical protein
MLGAWIAQAPMVGSLGQGSATTSNRKRGRGCMQFAFFISDDEKILDSMIEKNHQTTGTSG